MKKLSLILSALAGIAACLVSCEKSDSGSGALHVGDKSYKIREAISSPADDGNFEIALLLEDVTLSEKTEDGDTYYEFHGPSIYIDIYYRDNISSLQSCTYELGQTPTTVYVDELSIGMWQEEFPDYGREEGSENIGYADVETGTLSVENSGSDVSFHFSGTDEYGYSISFDYTGPVRYMDWNED